MTTTLKRSDLRITELIMDTWADPPPTTAYGESLVTIENLDHPALVCALPSLTG
jgi:hypothetical protein